MKKALSLALFSLFGIAGIAQSLTGNDVTSIRESFIKDSYTKAVRNVLTNDKSIKGNAINNDLSGKIDHYFKYRVSVKGITDQHSSGRCWMFTSMNVLRPIVMEKYNLSGFDFSHNYLYFWDMFEKSNLFLENIIATSSKPMDDREVTTFFSSPVGDGGVWNLFYNVATKYGVVPASVMPETAHSDNTSQLNSILNELLRKRGYALREMSSAKTKEQELKEAKIKILKDVYRVLALTLGEPPVEFTWRYKNRDGKIESLTTTPAEFYKSIVPADYSPDNYIMIMNDPTREYYKIYEIKNYRNTVEGINWIYLNLPSEVIKEAAVKSIKANEAMYASCDVGKQADFTKGVMDPSLYDFNSLLGVDLNMDKKSRILTRQSGSSHAMTLIGCDTDDNERPLKWEFENSWGAASGNNGYLTFTDKWFEEYLFRIVIHKKYLDQKSLNALNTKPILLPVWDYMN